MNGLASITIYRIGVAVMLTGPAICVVALLWLVYSHVDRKHHDKENRN